MQCSFHLVLVVGVCTECIVYVRLHALHATPSVVLDIVVSVHDRSITPLISATVR
jgi:hypothetical protein